MQIKIYLELCQLSLNGHNWYKPGVIFINTIDARQKPYIITKKIRDTSFDLQNQVEYLWSPASQDNKWCIVIQFAHPVRDDDYLLLDNQKQDPFCSLIRFSPQSPPTSHFFQDITTQINGIASYIAHKWVNMRLMQLVKCNINQQNKWRRWMDSSSKGSGRLYILQQLIDFLIYSLL